jgi:hypothetical protein
MEGLFKPFRILLRSGIAASVIRLKLKKHELS